MHQMRLVRRGAGLSVHVGRQMDWRADASFLNIGLGNGTYATVHGDRSIGYCSYSIPAVVIYPFPLLMNRIDIPYIYWVFLSALPWVETRVRRFLCAYTNAVTYKIGKLHHRPPRFSAAHGIAVRPSQSQNVKASFLVHRINLSPIRHTNPTTAGA